ncbi:CBS domain-containing protein [Nocardiopsis mangrovi]|uniref:CBS domain-containing protein n=1 Tax=Nocardiopsis mangrovi TaxID=1179818 RepID=A0ABV9DYI7_9ACTN
MADFTSAAWMIRGGRWGEREEAALREGLTILGWDELDDIGGCSSKEELRELITATYPGSGKARIANWTGQLWRFLSVIDVGDYIVMPRKDRPSLVAFGRVTGAYRYRGDAPPGFRLTRPVEWLRTDVPRSAIKRDLLDSMGSLLTVCRLSRFDAARRVADLAEHGTDPGPGTDADQPDEHRAASRAELLAKAAHPDSDSPLRLTVREFLEYWGATRRTSETVARIEKELDEKGLTTRPPFTEGWIHATIELVPLGEEPVLGESSTEAQVAADTEDVSDLPPMTLRIGDLDPANRGVTSVAPGTPLRRAITMMLVNNYSQLAVISEEGTFHGAVSWESMGQARVADPKAPLENAITSASLVEYDEPLLNQIRQIYDKGFVFVRSPDKSRISGIITAADLTQQFDELARPFVLIEEAERRLRRRVDEVFTLEEIRAVARRNPARIQSAADLTLGNYRFLLTPEENWDKLAWNLDQDVFLELLKAVNAIRNETMHFSPDPLTPEQFEQLNGFVGLLRTVDPAG